MIALNICRRLRGEPYQVVSMDAPNHREIQEQLEDPDPLPDKAVETQQQQTSVKRILEVVTEPVRLTVRYRDSSRYPTSLTSFAIDTWSAREKGRGKEPDWVWQLR